jgi:ribosomal protein L31
VSHVLQGNSTMLVVDEGQLNKFKKRFAGLEEYAEVGG